MARVVEVEHIDVNQAATTRPVAQGTRGIVTSGHSLTTMAAVRMLLSGGNAFDAAVAAGFAAAVLEPTASYTIAAEGVGMVYHAATGEMLALSGQGVASQAQTVAYFRGLGLDRIPTGPGDLAHLSFTVPGVVDAYLLLLSTYGTKPVREVLEPTIDYAEHGFPMYEYMHRILGVVGAREQFDLYPPGGPAVFYPDGMVPPVGGLLIQPQLGRTLRTLVDAERAASGARRAGIEAARHAFYEGEIAHHIVDFSQQVGGLLQLDDLAAYRAKFEAPISTTFAGYDICTQNTWTQAAVLLQALKMLEHVDLRALGHNALAYIPPSRKSSNWRLQIANVITVIRILPPCRLRRCSVKTTPGRVCSYVDADRASSGLPAPGDPLTGQAVLQGAVLPLMPAPAAVPVPSELAAEEGTTHFSVVDGEGNMVCITPCGGVFRKSAFVPVLGCTLSTRSEMFFVDDSHPNGLQPGKRPRTTLINYFACRNGEPVMTFGCPGGDDQAQANLQLILNVMVFGMNPQQAVEAPRFSSQSVTNSFYPRAYYPGQLNMEVGMADETVRQVAARGHRIARVGACGIGAIVTQRDPARGVLVSGADPRRPTYGIGI